MMLTHDSGNSIFWISWCMFYESNNSACIMHLLSLVFCPQGTYGVKEILSR